MRLPWLPRERRASGDAHPTGARERVEEWETVAPLTPPFTRSSHPRLTSSEVTALRVRALQGDSLREVRDATREWVFRSLLIGKHLEEWAELAGITEPIKLERALEQVRQWYQQRLTHYAREQVQHFSCTRLL